MSRAIPIIAFAFIAAAWAFVGIIPADLFRRCTMLWSTVAFLWMLTEVLARTNPPDETARWLGRVLPSEWLRFSASRRVFAVVLGVIFLIAFWSWGSQVRGLVGERGIFPVGEQITAARAAGVAWWQAPSLSWFATGDTWLIAQCWLGIFFAAALALGICPGPCALLCWALYLSLMSVGGVFANFQWDSLLLETSLLAALWMPWKPRPDWGHETFAQTIGRWLLWCLLLRLMFESGVVKLTWGDESWLGYSALDYHFETQPLPLWTGWYAHQLPRWILRAGSWFTYFLEIATPILLLGPPRWKGLRHLTVLAQIPLQIAIAATGNYTFFNLLTVALCLPFLDDSFHFPQRLKKAPPLKPNPHLWSVAPAAVLAAVSLFATVEGLTGAFGGVKMQNEKLEHMRTEYALTGRAPSPPWYEGLRSFNSYGLFRTMTRTRPEIIIEGSADGVNWREYEFPYKVGDPYRRPVLVAPHQPRLDWQMWFAALSPPSYQPFLERLLQRLLEAEPSVLALMEKNPFPDAPPRFAKLTFYTYHFTRSEDHSAAWWKRDLTGSIPPVTLEGLLKSKPER